MGEIDLVGVGVGAAARVAGCHQRLFQWPTAYMINLDHRTDRWERQQLQAQRFGLTLERVTAERHAVGWVGCALSHQKALRAAQARGDPWVLIVEDDIVLAEDFVPHWQAVYQWLTGHEDQWDVFLGGFCLYRPAQGPVLERRCGLTRLQGTTCAHFGLIHQRAYERLLATDFRVFQEPGATCQRLSHWEVQAGDGRRFAPYDNYFQITGCRVVGCYPMLAGQEAGISDIEGHVMNYEPFFAATREHLKGLDLMGPQPRPPRCCLWDFWSDRRTVTEFWTRCGPAGQFIEWVGPEGSPDYHVVINRPGHGQPPLPDPGRTVAITMEPYWINDLWRDSQPLLAAIGHDHYTNLWEWHIGLTAAELADPATCQKREPTADLIDLSTVVSSKYFYPGHRLRVDFLRYAESQGLAIDIYGSSNGHGLRQYRKPLLDKRKAPGLCPYRYTLAVENMSRPHYCTEKVIDGILGECLTFYWGDPTIAARFPGATVWLPLDHSFEEALQIIRQHMAEGAWQRQLPAIRAAKKTVLEQGGCNAQIATIIRDLTTPIAATSIDRRPLTVMIGTTKETANPLGPTMTLWRNHLRQQLQDDKEFYLQRCSAVSGGWEGFYRQLITEIPLGHWVLWVPAGAHLQASAQWKVFDDANANALALDIVEAVLMQHTVAAEKWVREHIEGQRKGGSPSDSLATVRGVLLAPIKEEMPNFWQYDGRHILALAEKALAEGAGVVKIWIPDTQRCFHPELNERCRIDPRLELWTWSCLERRENLGQMLQELRAVGWE